MIADSYLQLRSDLETAVTGLLKLAGEMRRTPPWLDMLQGFLAEIREPLMLLALGESGAGKSTLLNALFGAEFVSGAGGVRTFAYGKDEATVDVSDKVRDIYLPLQFLREFKVIDTPALDQMLAEDRQLLGDLMAKADVVLLVVPLTRPWSTSAWQVFDVPAVPVRNFVFVLQQADLREPREIEIIRHNLEDTATQKLGFTPPIYSVSARDALFLKKNPDRVERPHLVEQFEALRQQITLVVTQSGGRTHKLRPACQLAQVVLHDIASGIRSSVEAIAHDESRVARAQALLQTRRQQIAGIVSNLIDEIDLISRQRRKHDLTLLRRRLSAWRLWTSVRSPANWLHTVQARSQSEQRTTIAQKIDNTAQILDGELRSVWPQVHDVVDQQLVTGAKDKIPSAPGAVRDRQEVVAKVRAAADDFATADLVGPLIGQVQTLLFWIRVTAVIVAVILVVAVCLLLFKPVTGVRFSVAALCALAGFVALSFLYRRRLLAIYEQAAESATREFTEKIRAQFEAGVFSFFDSIGDAITPMAEHCTAERQTWEPYLRRAEQLQRSLAETAARLR